MIFGDALTVSYRNLREAKASREQNLALCNWVQRLSITLEQTL
jgi:hypothetical protein